MFVGLERIPNIFVKSASANRPPIRSVRMGTLAILQGYINGKDKIDFESF
jgi:hypothetical protein